MVSLDSKKPFIYFVSLNTQGLRDRLKRYRLIQWITQQYSHTVFLSEAHFSPDLKNTLTNASKDFDLYHSYGLTNARGVSILVSYL